MDMRKITQKDSLKLEVTKENFLPSKINIQQCPIAPYITFWMNEEEPILKKKTEVC